VGGDGIVEQARGLVDLGNGIEEASAGRRRHRLSFF
jgi:hypothetical protein